MELERLHGMPVPKSYDVLEKFIKYCQLHPEERFWQALKNWSGAAYIKYVKSGGERKDTYYWEGERE